MKTLSIYTVYLCPSVLQNICVNPELNRNLEALNYDLALDLRKKILKWPWANKQGFTVS